MGKIMHGDELCGAGKMSQLTDMNLTSPVDGQIIKYDAQNEEWVNASLATVATTGAYSDLSGKPNLATVATSGSYNDLSNQPTIPTVGNGTITFQKNGVTVDSFTTNQSANKTINVPVDEAVVESISNTTPYLYRQSPAIGTRVMENALVGASVVKNQLVAIPTNDNSKTENGVTLVDNRDGSFTLSTVSGGATANATLSLVPLAIPKNHKVYLGGSFSGTSSSTIRYIFSSQGTNTPFNKGDGIYNIVDATITLYLQVFSGVVKTTAETKKPYVIDLTQMFGTTIADYAYTKEQSTAGSGIAWLKSQGFVFSKYISYNTGNIESVNPSAKKVVGFNQWDETWEVGMLVDNGVVNINATTRWTTSFIPVKPNTEYYASNEYVLSGRVAYYDGNKNCIYFSSSGLQTQRFTTPNNAYFMRITPVSSYGTTYNHDICINISKTTGSPKNGDYLPYEEKTYPITNPQSLLGLYKLVDGEIVAYGDRRDSDGSTQIIMTHHLFNGSEGFTYTKDYTTTAWFATTQITDGKSATQNVICDKFISVSDYGDYEGVRVLSNGSIAIGILKSKLSSVNTTGFATWLSNNNTDVQYEKATPTTETLPPFTITQKSFVGGTEEFITSNDVPVGHESEYKKLPPMFEDDYIQYLQEKAENAITECAYTSVVVNVPVSMSYTDKIVYVDFDVPTVQTYVGYTVDFSNCYVSLNAMKVAIWWDDVGAIIDAEKLLGTIVFFWRDDSNGVLKAQLEIRNIDLTSSDEDLAEAVLDLSFTIIGKPIITITS